MTTTARRSRRRRAAEQSMTRSLPGIDSARRIETGSVTSDTAEKYQFIKNITDIPHEVR